MALTPEQIAGFQAAMEEIAQPVIDWLLRDIAERVAEAGTMTSTAAYETYRARALGAQEEQLETFLKKQLGISEKEIKRLFEQAGAFSAEDDYNRIGVWATEAQQETLEQITEAATKLATKDFKNITQTIGMVSPLTGRPEPLQAVYRECMDEAIKLVSTGAASASEAARRATRTLAGRGIVSIDYESGVVTELGAAVRRNLMGGMGLMVEQITQQNHDALGCDGWEISAHANSAPDHEPYQGRQYSDAEYTRLNERLKRRIGTLNCGHVAFPVMLGVNSPQYTQAELEAFREENARGVTWEGRRMTGYEATQYQNRIERNIRTQKRRVLMDEASGDEQQLLTDQIKLTRFNQEYARFNRAMGFKSRADRLEVVGWGRSQAGKASAEAQQANRLNSANEELKILRESGKIRVKGTLAKADRVPGELAFGEHALKRMKERGISENDAYDIVDNALIVILQRNGTQQVYYSEKGFIAVQADGVVSSVGPLDDGGKMILEVAKKYGFKGKAKRE